MIAPVVPVVAPVVPVEAPVVPVVAPVVPVEAPVVPVEAPVVPVEAPVVPVVAPVVPVEAPVVPVVVPVVPPPVAQCDGVIVSLIRVTAPLRARARPSTVTLSFIEMDVSARMSPTKPEEVPSVAELPTCQTTLHGCAPLMSMTWLPDAVVRVEATWNMKTALGSPCASSVSAPVSPTDDVDL